jgi:ProP effector
METKRISSKEIIIHLAEKFPACFSLEGAVKPLKIGIFQELATELAEDELVSKTRLRQALRHYTSSWRYLKSIKAGSFRIDLTGKDAEEIDEAQAEYALKTLKESQEKFGNKKAKDKNAKKPYNSNTKVSDAASDQNTKAKSSAENEKRKAKFKSVKLSKSPAVKKEVKPLEAVETSNIKVDQKVRVQLGNSPMNATITEISGKDISVQLDSGMVIKTKIQNIYAQ